MFLLQNYHLLVRKLNIQLNNDNLCFNLEQEMDRIRNFVSFGHFTVRFLYLFKCGSKGKHIMVDWWDRAMAPMTYIYWVCPNMPMQSSTHNSKTLIGGQLFRVVYD